MKLYGFLIPLAVALALSLLIFFFAAAGPSDPACYALTDSNGERHESYYPPVPAADSGSTWAYQTDAGWGFVFSPATFEVDRNCLRHRGVQVNPIPTEVDTP